MSFLNRIESDNICSLPYNNDIQILEATQTRNRRKLTGRYLIEIKCWTQIKAYMLQFYNRRIYLSTDHLWERLTPFETM